MLTTQYFPQNATFDASYAAPAPTPSPQFFSDAQDFLDTVRALEAHGQANRSRCTTALQGSPLPCASGVKPGHCLHGMRNCSEPEDPGYEGDWEDAAATNGHRPKLLLDMDAPSCARQSYIWAVEIDTFADGSGSLLWQSVDGAAYGAGYTLRLKEQSGGTTSVGCMELAAQAYAEYDADRTTQQHVCAAPSTSDDELVALSRARYVELTLQGSRRQIFLRNVRVIERAFAPDLAAQVGDRCV